MNFQLRPDFKTLPGNEGTHMPKIVKIEPAVSEKTDHSHTHGQNRHPLPKIALPSLTTFEDKQN